MGLYYNILYDSIFYHHSGKTFILSCGGRPEHDEQSWEYMITGWIRSELDENFGFEYIGTF